MHSKRDHKVIERSLPMIASGAFWILSMFFFLVCFSIEFGQFMYGKLCSPNQLKQFDSKLEADGQTKQNHSILSLSFARSLALPEFHFAWDSFLFSFFRKFQSDIVSVVLEYHERIFSFNLFGLCHTMS